MYVKLYLSVCPLWIDLIVHVALHNIPGYMHKVGKKCLFLGLLFKLACMKIKLFKLFCIEFYEHFGGLFYYFRGLFLHFGGEFASSTVYFYPWYKDCNYYVE